MFRKLTTAEESYLSGLMDAGRLPQLNLSEILVSVLSSKSVETSSRGRRQSDFIIVHIYLDKGFTDPTDQWRIGISKRNSRDPENPVLGAQIALIRALRSDPIGFSLPFSTEREISNLASATGI